MRWLWTRLKEYAQVIVVMIVAGMITGACAIQELRDPTPPVKSCVEPTRLMPNWRGRADTTERWTI